jgi:hypothetical protein
MIGGLLSRRVGNQSGVPRDPPATSWGEQAVRVKRPTLLRRQNRIRYIKGYHFQIRGAIAMALVDVLPEVQLLSRVDKIRLIQILAQELERDDDPIESGRSYPLPSPDRAFTAAAALLQALEADKVQPFWAK